MNRGPGVLARYFSLPVSAVVCRRPWQAAAGLANWASCQTRTRPILAGRLTVASLCTLSVYGTFLRGFNRRCQRNLQLFVPV